MYQRLISFLIMSIICSMNLFSTQVIPHQVNPQIGENLWQMNYRESITLDDILDTTTLCCNCDFFITQADIDLNSGGYTITQPGNWCLGENIITTQPIVIENMTGVTFDLKGRSIRSSTTGSFADPTGIIDVKNSSDIVIKNGYIVGLDLGTFADRRSGVRFLQSTDCSVQNIAAQFLASVDNIGTTEGNFAFFVNSGHDIQFRDCTATGPFLYGFSLLGNNCVIENCEVSHFSGYLISGPLTVSGLGYWLFGDDNYVQNSTSMGGEAQPTFASAGSNGFILEGDRNVVVECVALNHKNNFEAPSTVSGGSGFYVSGDNCQISNCISANNDQYGIFNSGSGLEVCNNELHNNGISLSGTKESNLCNLLCSDYISQDRLPYTITEPGLYCIFGTLEETTGNAAITIADGTTNVVINFAGYTLERTALTHLEPIIKIGNGCEDIAVKGGRMKSDGQGTAQNIGIIVPASGCRLIEISDLSFEGFNQAINVGDTNKNITFLSCEGLNNNNFIFCTGSRGISVTDCIASQGTSLTDSQITFSAGCANVTIENTKVTSCGADGIYIEESNNINMSGLFISENEGNGIQCNTCRNISVDSTMTVTNSIDGIVFVESTNIILEGVSSISNFAGGISIQGNTGGAIPAECPVAVLGCVALNNRLTGIFFRNVGGVVVSGCVASGNYFGDGFRFHDGSWNVQVKDCVALSNGFAGFITWDTTVIGGSLFDNRFHNCHAAQNATTGGYVPGADDFCMSNTFGLVMLPPIAGPVPSALATIPPPLISVTPPDFCTFF